MTASWIDALLPPDPKKPRRKITENGKCRSCGADVFWTGYGDTGAFMEVVDCKVQRHRCHRVLPEDFEDLTK